MTFGTLFFFFVVGLGLESQVHKTKYGSAVRGSMFNTAATHGPRRKMPNLDGKGSKGSKRGTRIRGAGDRTGKKYGGGSARATYSVHYTTHEVGHLDFVPWTSSALRGPNFVCVPTSECVVLWSTTVSTSPFMMCEGTCGHTLPSFVKSLPQHRQLDVVLNSQAADQCNPRLDI